MGCNARIGQAPVAATPAHRKARRARSGVATHQGALRYGEGAGMSLFHKWFGTDPAWQQHDMWCVLILVGCIAAVLWVILA